MLPSFSFADEEVLKTKNEQLLEADKDSSDDIRAAVGSYLNPEGFLNIKVAHERKNQSAFGPKNSSAFALNPVITIGNFTFESDFYYGHQNTFTGYLSSKRFISRLVDDDKIKTFYDDYKDKTKIRDPLSKAIRNGTQEAHFYRLYSRMTYENKEHNFRVIVGDTVPRNFIGFQTPISGVGISLFRQSGDSSEINSGLPIVITRLSKIECKLGDDILAVRLFAPGVYTLEDFPEEAKIPGVKLKISDQLNRSDILTINYFSGYGMLEKGKDDFDFSVIFAHKWNILDPHKLHYNSQAHISANHRYGITDEVTSAVGAQYYDNQYSFDYNIIIATKVGIISPNIAYSRRGSDETKGANAWGAGLFYMTPENDLGLVMEVFGGAKASGFVDMGTGNEKDEQYLRLMKVINTADPTVDLRKYRSEGGDDSSRQLICRIYTKKPVLFGITPTFVFSGDWSSSRRYREYTLSLTKKIFDKATITVSAGLTYDDPYKGVNRESPDRRLTVACTIPLGTDVEIGGEYYHHDDDRFRNHAKIQYNPTQIPGLEITAEEYFKPQYRNPCASVKYDGNHFNIKVEEKITNNYGNNKSHSNEQRFFFGTSISPSKVQAYQKSSYCVLRSARKKK